MRRRPIMIYHILSLILEIGTIAAFTLGAWRLFPLAWRALAATAVFVVIISIWSALLMRQAPKRLPMPLLAFSIAIIALGAVAILAFINFELSAVILAFLAAAVVSLLVVLWLRHPDFMSKISPSRRGNSSKPMRPVNNRAKKIGGHPTRREAARRQTVGSRSS